MIRTRLLIFITLCFISADSAAQCLSSKQVWDRVEFLRKSTVPPEEQLTELTQLKSRIIKCKANDDSSYANVMQRMGAIYFSIGNFPASIDCTMESIKVGRIINGKTNKKYLAKGYFNLAMAYRESRRFKESVAAFDSCVRFSSMFAENLVFQIRSYRSMSNINTWTGDYAQAIWFADQAYLLAKSNNDPIAAAACLSEKAQALQLMRRFEEAAATIRMSIDLTHNELKNKKADNPSLEELANFYTIYAEILKDKGEPAEGVQYYQKAFAIFKQTGYSYGCFSALSNAGLIYCQQLKNYNQARRYHDQAIQYARSALDSIIHYINIGFLYFEKKDFKNALSFYQKGLHALPVGFVTTNAEINPGIEQLANATGKVFILELIIKKGDTWLSYYRSTRDLRYLQHAVSNYALADKLVGIMRREQQGFESKLFWRQNTHRLYENAIEVCFLLNQPGEAFYYFEQGKAVLLTDQLQEQDWLLKKDRSTLNNISRLKTELANWRRELTTVPKEEKKYDNLITLIFKNEKALNESYAAVRKRNPYYYNNFLDTSFITSAEAQDYLGKHDQSLLEFFVGDTAVYTLFIAKNRMQLTKIKKPVYDSCVQLYNRYISNSELLNRHFRSFVETSNKLYNLVFGDLKLPAGRLIISQDGVNFPFEALVTGNNDNKISYFLESHPITYTYSASYLMKEINQENSNRSAPFIGIAPVAFPASWKLAALKESDHSLARIMSNFSNPDILLFKEASKTNFMKVFNKYQIVQLYTHASDSGSTGEPVIYFADSILYLSDLITRENPATSLIVLSACETGSGQVYKGEGVFSFNRGFASLGIPASVTNLWTVDNESTYRLTELFYKYLAKEYAPDIALQQAKLEYMKGSSVKNQLPYYWAAMILAGTADPIQLRRHNGDWIWIAVASVVLMVGIFFWMRKRNYRVLKNK